MITLFTGFMVLLANWPGCAASPVVIGEPAEVAAWILGLADPAATWLTGRS